MSRERIDYRLPPVPQILYHPYFTERDNPLFKVNINPYLCGVLLQKLGLPDSKVLGSKIMVTAETYDSFSDKPNQAAQFVRERNVLFYMPSIMWNKSQQLSTEAALLRTGSSELTQVTGIDIDVYESVRLLYLDNNSNTRAQTEDRIQKDVGRFLGKGKGKEFFRYLNEKEDPQAALKMLREGSKKALIESLAYGLYQIAHPMDEYNLAQKAAILLGPALLTIMVVYAQTYLLSGGIYNKFVSSVMHVLTTLSLYPILHKNIPVAIRSLNLEEFKAGRFARQVSSNPYWNNLVVPEKGWD